ncbi:MAG: S-layer homology domain-containing protein [Clostridia bacterium]|nr:S-layer homology domain-containing protein [Clostridia bacterium]
MKKMKVVMSWIMTLLMLLSLMTGFQTASAATLSISDIEFDMDVTAVSNGSGKYTVKLPDGRPRIPQITCTGGEVVQAFMPDTATEATATVTKDGATLTVTFVKDASQGFVLQYNDRYTWNPGEGKWTFTSSNKGVASVNNSGEITINAVTENLSIPEADKAVTITATAGSTTKKLTITKTIRAVLGVWMLTGQSNAAYNYNDKNAAEVPAEGTALYYGPVSGVSASGCTSDFTEMNNNGRAAVGGTEPGIAKALYEKTGEKILILNAAIAGTAIGRFLPGVSTDRSSDTWALINEIYQEAYALWNKASFQQNYEVTVRSYFFLQGCAEVSSNWTKHYDGFAVTKNAKAFATLGQTYGVGTHTFHTYMTDILDFDYCMNIMVAWRPVGIVTSTRTAQFKLAEDLDDYFNVSRLSQTLSQAESTLRFDELHYTQSGKNIVGLNAGANAARIYTGNTCIEAAEGAIAFFNQIPYENGDTVYVKAGDFYNYCTRPTNYDSDDNFVYKFVDEAGAEVTNVIEYDGKNDFIVNKNAPKGATVKMEIYSETDLTTPLSTVTVQVVGETSDEYSTIDTETYSWDFTGEEAVTTAGDIDLIPDVDVGVRMEMSRDLMLDSDGYWSVEWQSDSVTGASMILSSAYEYTQVGTGSSAIPNYINMYFTTDTGWRLYRDSAYTDYFWRDYTGGTINVPHTYRLECRNNVYTFSIDGVVSDSRKIVEGHGSYSADSPHASSSTAGLFSNEFNVHYIRGGTTSTASSDYDYSGNVSYVKIELGTEKPVVNKVNNYPYLSNKGAGTQSNPYVITSKVAAGTVITPASFQLATPAGTATISADKFGGEALSSITCTEGTKSVYVMLLGALPYMSTFYRIDFTVSDDPDIMYYEVMVDGDKYTAGASVDYIIDGQTKTFIAGKSLFTTITEAVRLVGEDGIVYIDKGGFAEDVEINRSIIIKGAQAGVSPNAKGDNRNDVWTNTRSDLSAETVLTGAWTMTSDSAYFELDGVTLTEYATFTDMRTNVSDAKIIWNNVVVTDLKTNTAFRFGEATAMQEGVVTGSLTINDMRAYGLKTAQLMNTALSSVNLNNSYFEGTSKVDLFRVPGIATGSINNTAAYNVTNCMFDGSSANSMFQFELVSALGNTAITKYENVAISMTDNVFLNPISASGSLDNGYIYVHADSDNFTFAFTGNYIYENDASNASANTALIYGAGAASDAAYADYSKAYSVKKNRFIISGNNNMPRIFSAPATEMGHNNVNVGGNYAEVAGVVTLPITNETVNSVVGNPISYTKYYYEDADLTISTCPHSETREEIQNSSCITNGYKKTYCIACDELIGDEVLPFGDHMLSNWIVETEASCTEDGLAYVYCTVCTQRQDTNVLSATGHDGGKWKVIENAACDHVGKRALLCTACQAELGAEEEIPTLDHVFESVSVIKATCLADGLETFECISCGTFEDKALPQLLHVPGAWTVTIPATCQADGYREIRCTECNTYMDGESLAGEHTYSWVEIVPATDTEFGLEEYVCSVCSAVGDSRYILPLCKDATYKFVDIKTSDWFVRNGAMDFVFTTGLFAGTSDDTFSPNASMTRAMFVTVLGRLHGAAVNHKTATKFTDVPTGKWYSGYVAWAYENDIVDGISDTAFAPNAAVTREQICLILVNYCDSACNVAFNMPKTQAAKTFADAAKISNWAKKAVTACQRAGIIQGKTGNKFDPQGLATRAEVATIIMNFVYAQY